MQQHETIHLEIATITEKIILLNQQLAKTGNLIKAEIDLMNVYIDELKRLTTLLYHAKTNEKTIIKNTVKETVNDAITETSPTAPIEDKVVISNVEPIEIATPTTQENTNPIPELHFLEEEKIVVAEQSKTDVVLQEKAAANTTTATQKKSINEKFTTEKKPLIDKLAINKKSLKESISLSDKMLFINSLFHKDAALYEQVINQLNAAQSLSEAETIIASFQWDDKKEAVQIFKKMMKKRLAD